MSLSTNCCELSSEYTSSLKKNKIPITLPINKINKSTLLMRVTHSSVQLINLCPSNSRSNWNLEMLVLRREENQRTRRKTLGARARTNKKLNPHMTLGPRIEPGTHWWEANALTTAPPLLPNAHRDSSDPKEEC